MGSFVYEDAEANVEIEEEGETEQTIKNLKADIENIKLTVNKIAEDKEDKSEALHKIIEDKFKEISNTLNGTMEDKKEKVEAALKVFKEKTKDLNNIKTMVTKISEERREEKEGINNLEGKVSEIKELLNPLIPTLGFAKECIEVVGGSNKLLDYLRAFRREEMLANMVDRL